MFKFMLFACVLILVSASVLPARSQEASSDVIIREAKALADESARTIEGTKALFNLPSISEDKFITDLREQRAASSRLFTRIRGMIKRSDIATDEIRINAKQLIQQISGGEDLSDDDKAHLASPVVLSAADYFFDAHTTANRRLADAMALQKETNASIDELRKSGIDVSGEKAKWEEATIIALGRRPSTPELRANAIQTINAINPTLRSLLEKAKRDDSAIGSAKSEVVKYQKAVNTYRIVVAHEQSRISLNELKQKLQEHENDLEASINKIDERFVSKLNDNRTRDAFTAASTIVFGIAVIVVIVYFFKLADNDGVRLSLFQNDSGLQFVTLFSIVIAIILFGVLRILEGRELAALLGGLSGYILGRGSIGTNQSAARGQTGVPAGAPAQPGGAPQQGAPAAAGPGAVAGALV